MKKLLIVLLLGILLLSCVSCFGGDDGAATTDGSVYNPEPLTTTRKTVDPVDPYGETTTADPDVTTLPGVTSDPDMTSDPVVTKPSDDTTKTSVVTTAPDVTTKTSGDTTEPPVRTPVPRAISKSGTVRQDVTRGLIMNLDYNIQQEAGSLEMTVTLTLRLTHWRMYKSASGGDFTVNGQMQSYHSEIIDHMEEDTKAVDTLGTATFTVIHGNGETLTLDFAGDWYFGGTYGTQAIETIALNGSVTVR